MTKFIFGAMAFAAITCSFASISCAQSTAQSPVPQASATPQPAATETTVTVERGIVVPVLVTKEVRVGATGSAQGEHKVEFAVDQDVVYNGYLIAKSGDLAEGHYDTQTNQTKREFETTSSQEIDFYLDDIVNFCGDTIHLGFEKKFIGGVRSGFMSFGVHQHDAVVGRGDVLEASTDRAEKNICAQATTETSKPLPKNIMTPEPQITPSP